MREQRRSQPGFFRTESFKAIRKILTTPLADDTWMTIDQMLGAIDSGVRQAEDEFKLRRFKERGHHGRNRTKKV